MSGDDTNIYTDFRQVKCCTTRKTTGLLVVRIWV